MHAPRYKDTMLTTTLLLSKPPNIVDQHTLIDTVTSTQHIQAPLNYQPNEPNYLPTSSIMAHNGPHDAASILDHPALIGLGEFLEK